MSDNPNNNPLVTPNHFMIGQMGGDFLPGSVDSEPFNPRKRWRRLQELTRRVELMDERILTADWIKTEMVLP